jgi:hypothetical protein
VTDQVSHPYKTTGKIIVLYILIFVFLDSKLEDRMILSKLIFFVTGGVSDTRRYTVVLVKELCSINVRR